MYPASKIKLMIFRFFPNNGLLPRRPLHVNRPIPSSKNPYFQTEAKCTTFLLKMRILRSMAEHLTSSEGTRKWPINIPFLIFFSTVAERKLNPHLLVEDHTSRLSVQKSVSPMLFLFDLAQTLTLAKNVKNSLSVRVSIDSSDAQYRLISKQE